MTRIFLHGENILSSRQYLNELKTNFRVERWRSLAAADFVDRTVGFFERSFWEPSLFFLLEFFEKNELRDFRLEKLSSFLRSPDQPEGLLLWFGFEVPESNPLIRELRRNNFEEKKFNLSPQIFKLVDTFWERSGLDLTFPKALSTLPLPEKEQIFLVQMLIKRTRQILWATLGCLALKKVHPFIRQKIARTATRVGIKPRLAALYQGLVDLDQDLKSHETDWESRILLLYEKFIT